MRRIIPSIIALLVAVSVAWAAASYPTSVKTFTTKLSGETVQPAHMNEAQDEITAIEQGLLSGTAHNVKPLTTGTYTLGTSTLGWKQFFIQAAASQTADLIQFLNSAGNTIFQFTSTASMVNGIQFKPRDSGVSSPTIQAIGTDATVGLILAGKAGQGITIADILSAVDGITVTPAATANPATVAVSATGTDANINLNLVSKGTGKVQVNGSESLLVFTNAQTSTVDVTNTVTETDLYSVSIPQNTLTAGRRLSIVVWGDRLENAVGTLTIRVKLGATTIHQTEAGDITNSASRQVFRLDVDLFAIASNSQISHIHYLTPSNSSAFLIGSSTLRDTAVAIEMGENTSAEDNGAGALTFKVTAQWSAASASLSARALGVKAMVFP